MLPLLQQHEQELNQICRRFRVARLELFGSAASAGFSPATSDLDFLVSFEELPTGGYADAYFGLMEALQELLQHPVDLVSASAVTNPYFLRAIEPTRTVVYAA